MRTNHPESTPGRSRITTTRLSVAAILLASIGVASAGTNLGSGYPAHACGDRPAVPERPAKFETEAQIKRYNEQVDAYNQSMEQFVACIRTYVANAGEDIKRIRRLSREAVDLVAQ